ncbi:MAG: hypothetical protein EZS28_004103 [Streblomastix strix]|uniref:Uncharacterized protein n=1 Tax=Streblomastix strix TaxID=222440 RepID=A0A5J4X1Q8_9EUKA|nr:MAG: hypothetical protein EZS28_004103 [Streblomastix strix]
MIHATNCKEVLLTVDSMNGKVNPESWSGLLLSKVILSIQAANDFSFLNCSALSSDLNPLENFKALLMRRFYVDGRSDTNGTEPCQGIKSAAAKITKLEVKSFIDSFHRRLCAVMKRD